MMHKRIGGVLVLLTGLVAAQPLAARAAEIDGTWRTEHGWLVRIAPCGAVRCGKVMGGTSMRDKYNPNPALRQRKVVGIRLMWGLRKQGGSYKGKLYNPKDGKTYVGYVKPLSASAIKLSGCILGGLLCRSQTWKRVK